VSAESEGLVGRVHDLEELARMPQRPRRSSAVHRRHQGILFLFARARVNSMLATHIVLVLVLNAQFRTYIGSI
jgi:hypothetical protein